MMDSYQKMLKIQKWLFSALSKDESEFRYQLLHAYAVNDSTVIATDGYQFHMAGGVEEIANTANKNGFIAPPRKHPIFSKGKEKFSIHWEPMLSDDTVSSMKIRTRDLVWLLEPYANSESLTLSDAVYLYFSDIGASLYCERAGYHTYAHSPQCVIEISTPTAIIMSATRILRAIKIFDLFGATNYVSLKKSGVMVFHDVSIIDTSRLIACVMGQTSSTGEHVEKFEKVIKFASEQAS